MTTDPDGPLEGALVNCYQVGDTTAANNGGYFPVTGDLDNLFAFVNDDGPPCDCNAIGGWANLTSPLIDCSEISSILLVFDSFFTEWANIEYAKIEVSVGGEPWQGINGEYITDIPVDGSEWVSNQYEITGLEQVNTIQFRWQYSDGAEWAAGLAIDNILIQDANLPVLGCTDQGACNYYPYADTDDGTCKFEGDSCDDDDPDTFEDSINPNCMCIGAPGGCMDPEACNYDEEAAIDNGSCEYELCVESADFDGDGYIGIDDIITFIGDFGCIGFDCMGDLDEDGEVGMTDLLIILTWFGLTI